MIRNIYPILILIISLLSLCDTSGQDHQIEQCGTSDLPVPEHLEKKFRDYQNQSNVTRQITSFPLQIHIIRNGIGLGGIPDQDVYDALDIANERYAAAGISFYLCDGFNYINNDEWVRVDKVDEAPDIDEAYHVENVINVYIADIIESGNSTICGFANFPWSLPRDYLFLADHCMMNGSTFSHELGHYFGLLHTHSTSAGAELVDGSNCTNAGDKLCDTPADPKLSGSLVSTFCIYVGKVLDANLHPYQPDVSNIMSYSRKACRTKFSNEQNETANFYSIEMRNYLNCELQTSVNNLEPNALQMKVIPNPSYDGEIEILLNERFISNSPLNFTLWNALGEMIDNWSKLEMRNSFHITIRQNGIYFLTAQSGNQVATQKIVVSTND